MQIANKAIIRRFYEDVSNAGDLSAADGLVSVDRILHDAPPGAAAGRGGLKRFVTIARTVFPDLRVTVEDLISEGDKVVARITWHGTHTGTWDSTAPTASHASSGRALPAYRPLMMQGIPPTGRSVTMGEIDIFRIVDGKITEVWHQEDRLGALQQLGLVATPST